MTYMYMYNHVHVCLPGSEEKVKTCKEYGAHLAINYKQQNFATEVLSFTDNKGIYGIQYMYWHVYCTDTGIQVIVTATSCPVLLMNMYIVILGI